MARAWQRAALGLALAALGAGAGRVAAAQPLPPPSAWTADDFREMRLTFHEVAVSECGPVARAAVAFFVANGTRMTTGMRDDAERSILWSCVSSSDHAGDALVDSLELRTVDRNLFEPCARRSKAQASVGDPSRTLQIVNCMHGIN